MRRATGPDRAVSPSAGEPGRRAPRAKLASRRRAVEYARRRPIRRPPGHERGQARLQPAEIKKTLDRAVILHRSGKLHEAESLYRSVIKHRPNAFHAHHLLGGLCMQRNEHESALACFETAIRIEPRFPDAHHSRAKVLAELGRKAESEASFNRALQAIDAAIRASPNFTHAHYSRGRVLEELGRREEALESYEKALQIDPQHVDALNDHGLLLYDLDRPKEALTSLEVALALQPDFVPALVNRGRVLMELDRTEEALSDFDHALELHPNHVGAIVNRAKVLPALGDYGGAIAALKQAMKLSPKWRKVKFQFSNVFMTLNRYEEAAKYYKELLAELHDSDSAHRLRVLGQLARIPPQFVDFDVLSELEKIDPANFPAQIRIQAEISLAFAKATANHNNQQYELAWNFLETANRLKRATIEARDARFQTEWCEAINRMAALPASLDASIRSDGRLPITLFVLGPTRVGKTTVETLAESLGHVRSGYENRIIDVARQRVLKSAGLPQDLELSQMVSNDRARFTDEFAAIVSERSNGADVFTCTLPGNINRLSDIIELVPNSRFIFLRRDRDDLALRIFMKHYKRKNLSFAYDLRDIDAYIDYYETMIEMAETQLPQCSITLRYEDTIAHPAIARAKIAAHCGLPAPTDPLPELGDDRGVADPYKSSLAEARAAFRSHVRTDVVDSG